VGDGAQSLGQDLEQFAENQDGDESLKSHREMQRGSAYGESSRIASNLVGTIKSGIHSSSICPLQQSAK
jgi:hypothetical protein